MANLFCYFLHLSYLCKKVDTKMMNRWMDILMFFVCLLPAKAWSQDVEDAFPYPQVPSDLRTPAERARFVVTHYWDGFNFQDTAFVLRPELVEQGFANFVDLLPRVDGPLAMQGIDVFSQRAYCVKGLVADYFALLSERYLFNEDSPLRNDTLYALFLEAMDSSPWVDPSEKERHGFLIGNIRKNRVGSIAADFSFVDSQGKEQTVHGVKSPYTLLYIYDPDCEYCHEVYTDMQRQPSIVSNPDVMVVEVDASKRRDLWNLYFFRSFPAIYLLDADKRVVEKDATIERVLGHLRLQ